MKRALFTLTALLFLTCFAAYGQPISRRQAQVLALEFATGNGMMSATDANSPSSAPALLTYGGARTMKRAASAPVCHVFNIGNDEGFVIVSGDKRTETILGYSRTGHFDLQNLPDNARAWLDGIAEEVEQLGGEADETAAEYSPSAQPKRVPHRASYVPKAAIAPMITSHWNQREPYNNLCPVRNNQRCITGCAATALAQVLYYHRKESVKATEAEITSYDLRGTDITIDGIPAGTVLDWDNMLDDYVEGSYTEEQATAVAQLMLYCGVAMRMGYSPTASGAANDSIVPPMKRHFGYDAHTVMLLRNAFGCTEWEDMIYNELTHDRPVLYTGNTSSTGHAFVVDGFDGEGLFHVNWGWGGTSDGYFVLTVLNPYNTTSPGASYTSDGFSNNQMAVFNAQPRDVREPLIDLPKVLTAYVSELQDGRLLIYFQNYTGEDDTYGIGYGVMLDDGNVVTVDTADVYNEVANRWIWPTHYFDVTADVMARAGVPYGTYDIIPLSKHVDSTSWTRCPRAGIHRVSAAYGEDGVSLTFVSGYTQLEITDIVPLSATVDTPQTLRFTLANHGEADFVGSISLRFTRGENDTYVTARRAGVAVPARGEQQVEMPFSFNNADDYTVYIYADATNQVILGQYTFSVTTGIASPTADDSASADDAWYNLMGQRVQPDGKGIYIRKGKKVVVR